MKNTARKKYSGFLLVEVIIVIAVIALVFFAFVDVSILSLKSSSAIQKKTQANLLVKEEFEALRSIRAATEWNTDGLGFVTADNASPYYAYLDSTVNPAQWTLRTGTETTADGIFTRKITFNKTCRGTGTPPEIIDAPCGPTYDTNTIKATVTVSWTNESNPSQIQASTYLTNWR